MTGYLLDRDVLSAAENPEGNRNVHIWIDGIPDRDLYLSAVTVMEARKGFARQRAKAKTDTEKNEILGYEADFDDILAGFEDRWIAPSQTAGVRCSGSGRRTSWTRS